MTRPVLAVTRRLPAQLLHSVATGEYELRLHDSVEPLRERLPEFLDGAAAAILAPYDRVDADLLARCPSLRIAANASAGHDNLDLGACTARGVMCTNAPDGVTRSTADFAVGLLIAAARRIPQADALVRAGGWGASTYEDFMSAEIGGSTLGILGIGRIGQAIARRAAHGFGMRVLYWSRSRLAPDVEAELGCTHAEKARLLGQADHVIATLPYGAATHHAMGAVEFAAMRAGATFVNVGRGGVVDEVALATSLQAGHLGAAALDVFEGEPKVKSELLDCPRLLMTPHIASATLSARLATLRQAIDNVSAVLAGRVPPNLLNRELAPG